MPAIYHEGSWLGNATDPEVLVKDTVGWTGKNRAYSQTNNAVIAHIENDITYDVSWTGSATVTLKKNSTSGATITSGSTSPLSFTADADYELYFGSSATVTNIMVKDSRITDPTYEPYHESVEVMYEEEVHGVNLLKNTAVSKTENGITFTVNADGSVTVNGTATAAANLIIYDGQKKTDAPFKNIPVILSKGNGASVANTSLYCNVYQGTTYVRTIANCQGVLNTESDVFEVDYNGYDGIRVGIAIPNGVTLSNAVFRPMLRKATIEDSTYHPYNHQAIQNQLNAQGVLGAKNLCPFPTNGNRTEGGVTFTVNSDGSISLSGTATAYIVYTVDSVTGVYNNKININLVDGKKYKLTGCPANGGNNKYTLALRNGTSNPFASDMGNGVEYTHINANNDISVVIRIFNGQNCDNLTFYPMLRLASDPDDTYQPYAMTNRELTDIATQTEVVTLSRNTSNTTSADIKLFRYGKLRILTGFIAPTVADTGQTDEHSMVASNLSSNDRPQEFVRGLLGRMGTTAGIVIVYADGRLQFVSNTTQNVYFNITWITK